MTAPSPIVEANGAAVYHAGWRDLLEVVPTCNALIVDAPYSERTHAANDGSAKRDPSTMRDPGKLNRPLNYACWDQKDVGSFVCAWASRVSGWFVSITDHTLAPYWSAALESAGRYVFAPIAFVATGSRIRLLGDGPSNWATWIVVARPRTKEMAKWGTLPGAYVLPPGEGGAMPVVGGKPRWLMESLVRDYTRPGDLVVDPCCGAGTTLAAAVRLGRRAVGGDVNPEHAEMAARWVIDPGPTCPTQDQARQRVLF